MKINRRTVDNKHVYTIPNNNTEYIGITSILNLVPKPWVTTWKLNNRNWERDLKKAIMIGNIVHLYCQIRSYVGKDEIDTSFYMKMKSWREIMNGINAFELFVDQYQPKFLHSELKLINLELGYGCTVDAVLEVGEEIFILDYKTSTSLSEDHKIQVIMCAMAYIQSPYGKLNDCIVPAVLYLNKKNGKPKLVKVGWDYYKTGKALVEDIQ